MVYMSDVKRRTRDRLRVRRRDREEAGNEGCEGHSVVATWAYITERSIRQWMDDY